MNLYCLWGKIQGSFSMALRMKYELILVQLQLSPNSHLKLCSINIKLIASLKTSQGFRVSLTLQCCSFCLEYPFSLWFPQQTPIHPRNPAHMYPPSSFFIAPSLCYLFTMWSLLLSHLTHCIIVCAFICWLSIHHELLEGRAVFYLIP